MLPVGWGIKDCCCVGGGVVYLANGLVPVACGCIGDIVIEGD